MKKLQYLFLLLLTLQLGLVSCQGNTPVGSEGNTLTDQSNGGSKPTQEIAENVSSPNDTIPYKEDRSAYLKERYPDPRDSVLRNYVDHRKPPKDSIDKWNAEVMAEKKKYTVQPDENTKKFTIDPETGEVNGCPYIKFKEFQDDAYWTEKKLKRDSLKARFAAIKPKIRPAIMEGHEGELWYGDPRNVEIEGTPEAAHAGRGPIGFLYTDDGQYLIVPAGYPHGGTMEEIFFFDTVGNLLSKTVLDRPLNMPSVDFNAEQTFVIVSDGVSGDFYFFRPNGELFRKGNFNELTGDRGTSYGKPVISENGKYWVLNNNLRWVFEQGGNNILKTNLFISEIDEHEKIALCHEYINLMRKEVKLYILNLESNKLIWYSNNFQLKNFSYEINN